MRDCQPQLARLKLNAVNTRAVHLVNPERLIKASCYYSSNKLQATAFATTLTKFATNPSAPAVIAKSAKLNAGQNRRQM
jgi:hypothetical protein